MRQKCHLRVCFNAFASLILQLPCRSSCLVSVVLRGLIDRRVEHACSQCASLSRALLLLSLQVSCFASIVLWGLTDWRLEQACSSCIFTSRGVTESEAPREALLLSQAPRVKVNRNVLMPEYFSYCRAASVWGLVCCLRGWAAGQNTPHVSPGKRGSQTSLHSWCVQ